MVEFQENNRMDLRSRSKAERRLSFLGMCCSVEKSVSFAITDKGKDRVPRYTRSWNDSEELADWEFLC